MARIKIGIKFFINYLSLTHKNRDQYIQQRAEHRVLSELEAHDVYLCEAREADKHIHSMRFLP